jgi:L-rhamnose mutarotase
VQQIIAVCVVAISCLLAPVASCAADPSESPGWLQRRAQVSRILPDHLARFRQQSAQLAPTIGPCLIKHGIKNQNLFTIELEPKTHYVFRYHEYHGKHFIEDMQRLQRDPAYRHWTEILDECVDGWSDVNCVFFTDGQRRSRVAENRVQRMGRVVGLRPDMVEPYVLLHAHTWPGVLSAIREGNIRNYSIFLAPIDAKVYLFAYLEYVGENYESDMARIGADPDTTAWIKFTDEGCQLPIPTRKPGEWWASMERL